MKEKKVAPEEIVFKEGDFANKLIFIIDGSIELFIN